MATRQMQPKAVRLPQDAEWTAQEAVELREFLNSYTGQLFLRELRNGRPAIVDDDPKKILNKEAVSITSTIAHGWESSIKKILEMAKGNRNQPENVLDPEFVNFP